MTDLDLQEDLAPDEYLARADRRLDARLRIMYVDENGEITYRTVDVVRYGRTSAHGGVIFGHCHLRGAMRTFRLSRVRFAADLNRAERIHHLGEWLDARYAGTPFGQRDRFIAEHEAALGVLHHVAKADGAFRAKEKDLLVKFCTGCGLSDQLVLDMVVSEVASWAPSSAVAFGRDLKALKSRSEDYRKAVHATAEAIVASDKSVRDTERRALERLTKELGLRQAGRLVAQSSPAS
ncbi:MAG: TerB family tellurite resistance protein [Caldimonas sp.]|uniref:TerB family tellurite resistance protein n=1 Tax=Caldimonas sp. TaxID=2838790 RepID=UPI00391C5450